MKYAELSGYSFRVLNLVMSLKCNRQDAHVSQTENDHAPINEAGKRSWVICRTEPATPITKHAAT